jgi:hypothetical protein
MATTLEDDLGTLASRTRTLFLEIDTIQVETVVGMGQKLADEINGLATFLGEATSHIGGKDPLGKADAERVSGELMNELLSPVRTLLRALEKKRYPISQDKSCKALQLIAEAVAALGTSIDTYSAAVANVLSSEVARANLVKNTLDTSVEDFLNNWHPELVANN